jgi:hypothetical protein
VGGRKRTLCLKHKKLPIFGPQSKKDNMKKLTLIVALCVSGLMFTSCGGSKEGDKNPGDTLMKDTVAVKKDSAAELKEFKFFTVLASIPSPAHEVIEIKNSGMKYNSALLNPKENESKYSDNDKVCFNYGIYSTDLAYCASYKDNADMMKYFMVNRKMAEKAGALSVFEEVIKADHFEEHIHNSDSLELILDKVFVATEKFCQNQHKLDVAVKVLLGSWVESNYIVLSNLKGIDKNDKNKKLYDKVWENFLHLRNFIDLLKEYENHPELTDLSKQLAYYADLYKDVHGAEDLTKERVQKLYEAISSIRSKMIE